MRESLDYGTREMEATFEAMEAAADVRIMRENFENLWVICLIRTNAID